jgi:hypothetical protein
VIAVEDLAVLSMLQSGCLVVWWFVGLWVRLGAFFALVRELLSLAQRK